MNSLTDDVVQSTSVNTTVYALPCDTDGRIFINSGLKTGATSPGELPGELSK